MQDIIETRHALVPGGQRRLGTDCNVIYFGRTRESVRPVLEFSAPNGWSVGALSELIEALTQIRDIVALELREKRDA